MRKVFLSTLFLALANLAGMAAERPPNVVFLLADDLGWGDLSCHGSSFIKTPHLDALAKEGTDFRRFNVASPVCSPSRVGFMTGNYPARYSVREAIGGVKLNEEKHQVDWLDPNAVMLPRLLQTAGYVTGHFGKWHLQSSQADDAPLPEAYGISEYALFAGTANPRVTQKIEFHGIWDSAVAFIHKHQGAPFYMNVWMHETHLAHVPTPEALEANKHLDERQRIYAAVATDADEGAGKILAALKELGLEQNTIVVFASDNGPENTSPTMKKMRGGYGGYYSIGETGGKKGRKRSLHEGGISTPFIVRWPGHVPANRVEETTQLAAVDLLPTVCAALSVPVPAAYAGDGENMLPAWQGAGHQRTKALYWDWSGTDRPPTNWPRWSVHDGEWKLLVDDAQRAELYRLGDDAAEAQDMAGAKPEIVAKLRAELDTWRASLPKEAPAQFLSIHRQKGSPPPKRASEDE